MFDTPNPSALTLVHDELRGAGGRAALGLRQSGVDAGVVLAAVQQPQGVGGPGSSSLDAVREPVGQRPVVLQPGHLGVVVGQLALEGHVLSRCGAHALREVGGAS